jgi:hypothetical protein
VGEPKADRDADARLQELLGEVKKLAREYYELTGGRPLGVTGEVAEHEAARLLDLRLAAARQSGFDAWRGAEKLQIKGCCIAASRSEKSQRMPKVKTDREWDCVLLVLMNHRYETYEIWEADRATLLPELGSVGMPVLQFKGLGHQLWPSTG